jgi:dihydrofolate reductase
MISHIAALSSNRVIGVGGQLPWKISLDLKYFKDKTVGKCIIMGRKTYDSLGKPLPNRHNIVVTRDSEWFRGGIDVFPDIDSAIKHAQSLSSRFGDEIMIVGGAEIYKQTLPIADRLYLTLINKIVEGDAFYPDWRSTHVLKEKTEHEENGVQFSFCIFEKK